MTRIGGILLFTTATVAFRSSQAEHTAAIAGTADSAPRYDDEFPAPVELPLEAVPGQVVGLSYGCDDPPRGANIDDGRHSELSDPLWMSDKRRGLKNVSGQGIGFVCDHRAESGRREIVGPSRFVRYEPLVEGQLNRGGSAGELTAESDSSEADFEDTQGPRSAAAQSRFDPVGGGNGDDSEGTKWVVIRHVAVRNMLNSDPGVKKTNFKNYGPDLYHQVMVRRVVDGTMGEWEKAGEAWSSKKKNHEESLLRNHPWNASSPLYGNKYRFVSDAIWDAYVFFEFNVLTDEFKIEIYDDDFGRDDLLAVAEFRDLRSSNVWVTNKKAPWGGAILRNIDVQAKIGESDRYAEFDLELQFLGREPRRTSPLYIEMRNYRSNRPPEQMKSYIYYQLRVRGVHTKGVVQDIAMPEHFKEHGEFPEGPFAHPDVVASQGFGTVPFQKITIFGVPGVLAGDDVYIKAYECHRPLNSKSCSWELMAETTFLRFGELRDGGVLSTMEKVTLWRDDIVKNTGTAYQGAKEGKITLSEIHSRNFTLSEGVAQISRRLHMMRKELMGMREPEWEQFYTLSQGVFNLGPADTERVIADGKSSGDIESAVSMAINAAVSDRMVEQLKKYTRWLVYFAFAGYELASDLEEFLVTQANRIIEHSTSGAGPRARQAGSRNGGLFPEAFAEFVSTEYDSEVIVCSGCSEGNPAVWCLVRDPCAYTSRLPEMSKEVHNMEEYGADHSAEHEAGGRRGGLQR